MIKLLKKIDKIFRKGVLKIASIILVGILIMMAIIALVIRLDDEKFKEGCMKYMKFAIKIKEFIRGYDYTEEEKQEFLDKIARNIGY